MSCNYESCDPTNVRGFHCAGRSGRSSSAVVSRSVTSFFHWLTCTGCTLCFAAMACTGSIGHSHTVSVNLPRYHALLD